MKKYLVITFIVLLLSTIPSSKQDINNTVTNNRTDNEIQAVVTKKPRKKVAKATKKTVHEGTVTPLVTSTTPNCDAHDKLLARYFGDDIRIAKAVMQAESGCRTDAVGDGHITYVQNGVTYGMSCGLFQIRFLPGRPNCKDMQDASKNIAYAASMYKAQGWYPWSAYLNNSYIKFLR